MHFGIGSQLCFDLSGLKMANLMEWQAPQSPSLVAYRGDGIAFSPREVGEREDGGRWGRSPDGRGLRQARQKGGTTGTQRLARAGVCAGSGTGAQGSLRPVEVARQVALKPAQGLAC